MSVSFDDPEMSFRRGYVHGARELFRGIDGYLPPTVSAAVKAWLERDVANWRLLNQQGEHSLRHGAP